MNELKSTVMPVEHWYAIRRTMLSEGTPLSVLAIARKCKAELGCIARPVNSPSGWKVEFIALDWYDAAKKTIFLLRWGDEFEMVDAKPLNTGHRWSETDFG